MLQPGPEQHGQRAELKICLIKVIESQRQFTTFATDPCKITPNLSCSTALGNMQGTFMNTHHGRITCSHLAACDQALTSCPELHISCRGVQRTVQVYLPGGRHIHSMLTSKHGPIHCPACSSKLLLTCPWCTCDTLFSHGSVRAT